MWALELQHPRVPRMSLAAGPAGAPQACCPSDEHPPPRSLPSKFTLRFLQEAPGPCSAEQHVAGTDPPSPPSELQPFLAPVVTNQRVTGPSHFQDVRLIEFDVAGSGIR